MDPTTAVIAVSTFIVGLLAKPLVDAVLDNLKGRATERRATQRATLTELHDLLPTMVDDVRGAMRTEGEARFNHIRRVADVQHRAGILVERLDDPYMRILVTLHLTSAMQPMFVEPDGTDANQADKARETYEEFRDSDNHVIQVVGAKLRKL